MATSRTSAPSTSAPEIKPISKAQEGKLQEIQNRYKQHGQEVPKDLQTMLVSIEEEGHGVTSKAASAVISTHLSALKTLDETAARREEAESAGMGGAETPESPVGTEQGAFADPALAGAFAPDMDTPEEEAPAPEADGAAPTQGQHKRDPSNADIALNTIVFSNMNAIRDLYAVEKGLGDRNATFGEEHKEAVRTFKDEALGQARALKSADFSDPNVSRAIKDLRISIDRVEGAVEQAEHNLTKFEPESSLQRRQAATFGAAAAAQACLTFDRFKTAPITDATTASGNRAIEAFRKAAAAVKEPKYQVTAQKNVDFVQNGFDHCIKTGNAEGAQAIIATLRTLDTSRGLYSPHAKPLSLGQFLSVLKEDTRNPVKSHEDLGTTLAAKLTYPTVNDPNKKLHWEKNRQAAALAYLFFTPRDRKEGALTPRSTPAPAPTAQQLEAAKQALASLHAKLSAQEKPYLELTPAIKARLEEKVGQHSTPLTEERLQKGFLADIAYASRHEELGAGEMDNALQEKIRRGHQAVTTRASTVERLLDLQAQGLI